jgi:hypothetical protein
VASQDSTGGVPDTEFANEFRITHTSGVEVVQCFAVPVELVLVEIDGLLKNVLFGKFRHAEFLP